MKTQEIFKELKDLYEQIPDFSPEEVLEIMNYRTEHKIEVDISRVLEKIITILQTIILEFINSEILHNDAGFPQKDNTYALYRYKYELLKNLNYDNFPPRILHSLIKNALLISMVFLSGFEQDK